MDRTAIPNGLQRQGDRHAANPATGDVWHVGVVRQQGARVAGLSRLLNEALQPNGLRRSGWSFWGFPHGLYQPVILHRDVEHVQRTSLIP
jgi:hypothetical protein